MSFFKKLFGQEDLPPEEKARVLAEKEEKRRQKEAAEMQLMEKYFGKSSGMFNKMNFSVYKLAIYYFENNIKRTSEEILAAIPAEYDKTKKREIKGMLIATSERLVFVTSGIGHGEFSEVLEYHKMNGISLAADGFTQKELLIDYGRSRKVFDDIVNDDKFKNFINIVRNKINEAKRKPAPKKAKTKPSAPPQISKYEQLSQIAKLRDQGVLTEEEFQREKEKILNS
jgi:CRISPR/Cas system-associated exonuclease Cas4 (RecB family)